MKLRELTRGLEIKKATNRNDLEILGISYDSKNIHDGFLFVAIKGEKTDGHQYIEHALKNGAIALIVEDIPKNAPNNIPIIQVENSKSALAKVSANFFEHPTKELTLVGITGTNGKTTITYLLESIWQVMRKNTGVIGTVEYRYSGNRIPSPMTTPESLDLMKLLKDMRSSGVEYVAMEVSSHALDRNRVSECHFDIAVFTNLTQDHLDYHETFENYLLAKKKLFSEVLKQSEKKEKFSIINIDDPYGKEIAKDSSGKIIYYSCNRRNEGVYVEKASITPEGIQAFLGTPWGKIDISSKLLGKHNLYNILAAVSVGLSLGFSIDHVKSGISSLRSVPGRLDKVENSYGINILIDYAHTPDALKNVLTAVRPLTPKRLILIFGCGGDRDPLKRPVMGKIGRELSDILIVTSDNPRTEPPELIIDEIENGIQKGNSDKKMYFRISDRHNAIRKGIEIAAKGDTILIAGKGHENYQILGTRKIPFDDKETAENILQEINNKECLN
jgi:UDP-N-acetylmuramoyl-L-alanyl-D-glutamate--2,6-diaminopimelate ligase